MTDKTIVSFLLDETGSMDAVRDKTVSGFNEYVTTLRRNDTPTLLRLMTFNTEGYTVVYDCEDIHSVADLAMESYRPRALTNLYDAIAKLVHDTEDYMKRMSQAPRVMCTIMTDGEENSSSEYTRAAIFKLIRDREKEGWAFVYLGANQDAWAASESIGIDRRNSANYQADAPNLPFDEWTEIFGSERLTGALLDRLTHHVHVLEMNGESFRLKQSRKSNQPPATD